MSARRPWTITPTRIDEKGQGLGGAGSGPRVLGADGRDCNQSRQSWQARRGSAGTGGAEPFQQGISPGLPTDRGGGHDWRVNVRGVDPRDQGWDIDRPSYRVCFFDASGGSDEYEVSNADVIEVLDWAEAQRAGRTYALYACVPSGDLGLVRLLGTDPNKTQAQTLTIELGPGEGEGLFVGDHAATQDENPESHGS